VTRDDQRDQTRAVRLAESSRPRADGEPATPPPVVLDRSGDLEPYYAARLRQHTQDWYCGLRMQKMPEDLRVYEHLLWASRADVVIELGVHRGGSTLWFRDRLVSLSTYLRGLPPRVIAVGLDTSAAQEGIALRDPGAGSTISFVDGSVLDPDLPDRVARLVPEGARCLVVEDTAHNHDTTTAALHGFSRFVPQDGFLVVEDGVVDDPSLGTPQMGGGGVVRAVEEWLASPRGDGFVMRRDLELYGLTSSPSGWLQRVR
jgi:cephalosporin hydroxylase